MNKVGRLLVNTAVVAIAYPTATIAISLLMVVTVKRGVGAAVTLTILVAAVLGGARMTMPRLTRAVGATRQRWTSQVFGMWKHHEQKRHLNAAERRIRTSVYDATTERTPMRSDDR